MTPHNKSSSDECTKVSTQLSKQSKERPRSSSSDARLPSAESNNQQQCHSKNVTDTRYELIRCKSDTTSNQPRSSSKRQLQTITSGIALDEIKSPTQSLPPLSPSKGCHSPQCQYYYHSPQSALIRRKSLPNDSKSATEIQPRMISPTYYQYLQLQGQQLPPCLPDINSDDQEQHKMAVHRSQNSHSSIDTSLKQGTFMQQLRANSHRSNNDGNDSDSAVDSYVDSIVFHYTPGDVPPAEYALPASILKVYGVDCECMVAATSATNSDRLASSLTNDDSELDCSEGRDNVKTGQDTPTPVNRYEVLPPQDDDSISKQQILLPYHERKRLTEMKKKEEKKNARKESKVAARIRVTEAQNSTLNTGLKYDYKQNQAPGFKLFDHLTALITGRNDQSHSDLNHKGYGSIEDESKQYLDKGKAFLQKTRIERTKFREQCKSDELMNVTVPVSAIHGSGHSRSKMSSLSNALDSIADCSDDAEEDSCSSDEETRSSYYDSESYSNTTESTKKVWNQGDPSITSKKASKRDRIMERERLLQEEYEFKLRRLTKENEMLAKKFRLFVLVTIAFILIAALSFAVVLCIKMLLLG